MIDPQILGNYKGDIKKIVSTFLEIRGQEFADLILIHNFPNEKTNIEDLRRIVEIYEGCTRFN